MRVKDVSEVLSRPGARGGKTIARVARIKAHENSRPPIKESVLSRADRGDIRHRRHARTGRLQKLIGSFQQRQSGALWRTGSGAGLASLKSRAAMLTDNLFAQILDTNLQVSAASWAFLNEIGAAGHNGISCYRRDHLTISMQGVSIYTSGWEESIISLLRAVEANFRPISTA
jgi:hypothetical protein